jgi:hypothetical protein
MMTNKTNLHSSPEPSKHRQDRHRARLRLNKNYNCLRFDNYQPKRSPEATSRTSSNLNYRHQYRFDILAAVLSTQQYWATASQYIHPIDR